MPGAETPTLPSMVVHYCKDWAIGWNRFWFSRTDTYVICVMRILTGWMLFYTHLVWSKDLLTFFSSGGVLPSKYIQAFHGHSAFAWSHFFWIESGWLGLSEATLIWLLHGIALSVFACFTLGLFTRMTAILSFLFAVSYANRASGALFGLDQMNVYLAMYLAIAPCGAALSLDSWWRRRRGRAPAAQVSVWANVILRLMQVHLCIIYFFAGTGKLLGDTWWNGEAIWGAFASYEYQTVDMTWMANFPLVMNAITLVALIWEVSYAYLVWPRLTRPLMVGMAFLVHAGIGVTMGMLTFGYIMIVANLAFVSPGILRRLTGDVLSEAEG